MHRPTRISIAVWLPVSVSLLIAGCVWAASSVMHRQSVTALRERAEDIAAGRTLRAAVAIRRSIERDSGDVRGAITMAERDQDLTLLVVRVNGRPLTRLTDVETRLLNEPSTRDAVTTLATQSRWIDTEADDWIGVGLRLNEPADSLLIAQASRATLGSELSILRTARNLTLIVVLPVSILAGLVLALMTALRLRRVTNSTRVLASGSFQTQVNSRFPDEIGELTDSFNEMRVRLGDLFTQVRAERSRLELVLSRLQQGVVAVDTDGRVAYANEASARVLRIADLTDGDPLPEPSTAMSLQEFALGLFADGAALTRVVVPVPGDRVLEIVGIPPAQGGDQIVSLVFTDLTEISRQERAEREFVANAAHQLRTPLATIRGSVDLLLAEPPPAADVQQRFLTHIQRETNRLNSLSRALLLLARAEAVVEPPPREATQLARVLRASADAVEPRPGVRLEVPAECDIEVLTNPDLLEQAVTNLIANAAAHTDDGHVTVTALADERTCTITVADSGSGITPDDRDHVFERFYRGASTITEGFGLGLAIAQASVAALDGELSIASTPGTGTTATITLPRTPAQHPTQRTLSYT